MRNKAFSWIFLIILLAGCRAAPLPQPTATIVINTQTPVKTPAALPSQSAGVSSSDSLAASLEALTAGNVQRMVPIARAGEGIFEDHIAVSPTGNLLAVATAGGVLLVDTATGQRRSFLASPSSVESVAFSPDGRQLAAIHREPGQEVFASGDLAGLPVSNPILTMVDLATGKARYERNLSGSDCGKYAAWDLAFAPDGKTLVFRDFYSLIGHARTDHLCLLSTGDGALLRPISIDLPWRTASPVVFTPDGKQLMVSVRETSTEVSSIPTTRIRIIETDTGKLLREIDGQGMVYDMALSPDGATLALADQRGARLLSVQDGRLFGHVGEHMREAISVGFTPDGTKLALGSLDGTASLWSIRDGQRQWQSTAWKPYSLLNAEDAAGEIWDMAFSSDGAVLFALAPTHIDSTSGRIHALRISDGQETYHVDGYNTVSHPGISPNQNQVAFGGYEDGQIQVWSVVENKPLFSLQGHTGLVTSVTYAPNGKQIASASLDGTVRIWNADDGLLIRALTGHKGPVRAVQFSSDGNQLASVGDDATLNLWNASDGRLLKSIATQVNNWLANSIMYSPDGQKVLLAYGCPYSDCAINREGDLRQVDLSTEQVQTLIPYGVYALTFSTDQANFAIDGEQQRQSGQRNGEQYVVQRSYRSPLGNGFTRGAAISPDGQLFFSGNFGGIHVWNATSGEMIALCKGAQLPYGIMRLSPDQKILFVASPDGVMSLWGVLSTQ